ncbi:MAG: hypothetical protein JW888_04915 [Pirellulales bacterium]|nr:hypothetical protein [Pirellulales bacterium]
MKTSSSLAMICRGDCRAGRVRTVLLALMFAAVGVPVYFLGVRGTSTSGTARSIVCLPADLTTQQQARDEILALPNVGRAVRASQANFDGCPGSPATVNSVRDRLRVRLSTARTSEDWPVDIHIECRYDTNPAEAIALTGRLAEQFAESARRQQKAEAAQVYQEAKQAADEARERLAKAQAQFDEFLQHQFEPAEEPALTAEDRPKLDDPGRPASPTVDPAESKVNPDWLAVRRQLDRARQYRTQLLVDRTPLHPMVRAADVEISDLEKRLAAIPHGLVPEQGDLAGELRQMTDPMPEPLGPIGPSREDIDSLDQPLGHFVPPTARQPSRPSVAEPSTPDDMNRPPGAVAQQRFDAFLARKHELDEAQSDYHHALAQQREAWQRQFNLPPVEVMAARFSSEPSTTESPSRRWTLISLLVALAGASGVGMVTTGITANTTFANAGEARAALRVPVLATVPGADHANTKSRRWRLVEGAIMVVCGLFLLAVCVGVLLAVGQVFTLI